MVKFTTIQITTDVKKKLEKIKNEKKVRYNTILEHLLKEYGGVILDDVETIHRESVAFSLSYYELDNPTHVKSLPVSFRDLESAKVGDYFIANTDPSDANHVNWRAEIVSKVEYDVIILLTELKYINGHLDKKTRILHVNLF